VDFELSNLDGIDLKNSYLFDLNLKSTNLSRAILSDANIGYTSFKQANLSNADLSRAILTSVTFEQANLRGANLSSIVIEESSSFVDAIYDEYTLLSEGFDPVAEGMKFVEE
jgi:uncharacterized protein YjbI with pentapeptide repeats